MANVKTSDESAASTLTGTELLRAVQSGSNVKTTTGAVALSVSDADTTLAANSDLKYATQKAVKAYIDALLAASNAVVYRGATDCSANPNYPAANAGDLYVVSVGGKIGGASGHAVNAGDMFICKVDSTASGNEAAVGANWNVIAASATGLSALADLRILANISGGTAAPIANTISDILDATLGSTRGQIMYRGASGWAVLGPGTAGYVLTTAGAGADPSWVGGAGATNYETTFGDGAAAAFTITHNLGTRAVHVTVFRTATPYDEIIVDNARPTTDTIYISGFAAAPASGEYTIKVSK